ncbi:MAG: redox-regulated ATPase YchF [Sphaerochaeta sp.]|jgi:GTP-binding protein YchF|nr:redox-regulated ATPase YchF [Sphaerochaeta sp.]MCI2045338.1 redox-regulated ATPase YchF [Sphaerochaeta sp.]MCI2075948.1 redox-regulated ATPase YchF [Sphaerochaeta sp.]MCI2096966.1 redox-regulated ATPase YchF [Sphaerochaeta sp.]MCI2104809.1 redox-regulated ATPase YchF [Sphaerochaeta sp.]
MGLNCGIVGLPNVGKSTIFSALTAAPAEIANYPFCTINPNVGIVNVPDKRLDQIKALIPPQRLIPATFEFVDIAGLVAGASKGEGLGNQFLANIREVGVIAHVVRCFDDADVIHVNNKVDPKSDIDTINTELALADLDTVENRYAKQVKLTRSMTPEDRKAMEKYLPLLEKVKAGLGDGKAVRSLGLDEEEQNLLYDLHLITQKPVVYVCNVDEDHATTDNDYVKTVRAIAAEEHAEVVVICGKMEAEIAALDDENDKKEFLESVGLEESGLNRLIQHAYHIMGLRTFFTAGPDEDRAWTFKAGMKAPETAGIIHTDFQKGFIKAEVYNCNDLFTFKSEEKIREAGKLRMEGKDYVVQDGDIMHFLFNVNKQAK